LRLASRASIYCFETRRILDLTSSIVPKRSQQPKRIAGALAILLMPCSVFAGFIDGGLEWLTVTDSINIAFEEIQVELALGGAFEGYRHATLGETMTLADTFGYDENLSLEANAPSVEALQAVLGTTFASSAGVLQFSTLGYIDDGTRFDIVLRLPDPGEPATFQGEVYQTDLGFLPEASPNIGHYLVRPVPEPATTIAMVGIVALGLVTLRRRFTSLK
jgi:hypothetical protein